jgi:hypothetical protein
MGSGLGIVWAGSSRNPHKDCSQYTAADVESSVLGQTFDRNPASQAAFQVFLLLF